MKSRPILFSTPMVQAILEGRKTQTRRVVKPQLNDSLYLSRDGNAEYNQGTIVKCPFGQVGDVLWVRETFRPKGHSFPIGEHFEYKATAQADGNPIDEPWKPSIFMPKDAARIWLKITNVRVERLNDISAEDSQKEGITWNQGEEWEAKYQNAYSYKFKMLWESINGEESWKQNPWVWVIEFERIEKPSEV